jgi:ribonuclease HII
LVLKEIIIKEAIDYAIAEVSAQEIDQMNILQASFLAMHRAIQGLTHIPAFLIVDGNRFKPYENIPHACIVKGDSKYASIAAASVLAKTHRDEKIETLAKEFPAYAWEKNKGYPTIEHRKAIQRFGITPWHRKSFQLLPAKTLFD